jgi:dimethylhistidine N-methyltransferase
MNPRGEAGRRFSLPEDLSPAQREMFTDVVTGLASSPKKLPSKYFYDERGSRLFDEITELDEYYLTRTETSIMEAHVSEMVAALGPNVLLVEFGSGSSAKTRILLDHMDDPVGYVPIDISGDYLRDVARDLRRRHPGVPILPLAADFTTPLTLPTPPRAPARRVVFFPGSTIGNFPVLEAARLLKRMRALAGRAGAVLLGFDLVKPRHHLHAAYNDDAGVTARFNLNLLQRLNDELDADFDLSAFRHHAPFNEEASRIEMHLVSRIHQTVHVGGHAFTLEPGESILTEFSHKYTLDAFAELARAAGLVPVRTWTDPSDFFCVQLLEAEEG